MNEGYVYFIGSPIFGWYKIGKSKTPEVRVGNLGILLPFKLHVIGVWKAKNHHLMEKALHEIHKESRINGEWFEFTKQEAFAVLNSIPKETRIFPSEDYDQSFATFSNVHEDTKKSNKVYGLKVQKLRVDFTPEQRHQKMLEGTEKSRLKREAKALAKLSK